VGIFCTLRILMDLFLRVDERLFRLVFIYT
jgi:hypothetical protein